MENGIEAIEIVDSLDIVEDGREKPIGKCAVFRFRSGEAKGMIYLYFDSLGIYGIWTDMKRFEKYKPAAILSAEEALSAAEESGNCIMDFTGEFEAERFKAEELSLDYWESMDGRYNLPVWKFSGSYLGDSGERIEGYIAVPALE